MSADIKKFAPRKEIMPEPQQALWQELIAFTKLGFVLYGGTAIALQVGHRSSVDFDFFTHKPYEKTVLTSLPILENAILLQENNQTYTFLVKSKNRQVKISCYCGLKIGRYNNPALTEDNVLMVADLHDLLATKLKTILQRAEIKDYKDIAAILNSNIPLEYGLAIAQKMFKNNYSVSESIKALNYFEDGNLNLLPSQDQKLLITASQRVTKLPKITRLKTCLV